MEVAHVALSRQAHRPIRGITPNLAEDLLKNQKKFCFPATQAPKNDDFLLKGRQRVAVQRFSQFFENKGHLLMHSVGSGKTLTSMTSALMCFDWEQPRMYPDERRRIVIVAPKGIHTNFVDDSVSQIPIVLRATDLVGGKTLVISFDIDGQPQEKQVDLIFKKYSDFSSSTNDREFNQKFEIFNNAVVIFDEAHRLFRPTMDPSVKLLDKMIELRALKGCKKFIVMTGTPYNLNPIDDILDISKFVDLCGYTIEQKATESSVFFTSKSKNGFLDNKWKMFKRREFTKLCLTFLINYHIIRLFGNLMPDLSSVPALAEGIDTNAILNREAVNWLLSPVSALPLATSIQQVENLSKTARPPPQVVPLPPPPPPPGLVERWKRRILSAGEVINDPFGFGQIGLNQMFGGGIAYGGSMSVDEAYTILELHELALNEVRKIDPNAEILTDTKILSPDIINKQFRKLSLTVHPDTCPKIDENESNNDRIKRCTENFQKLLAAKSVLIPVLDEKPQDDQELTIYDAALSIREIYGLMDNKQLENINDLLEKFLSNDPEITRFFTENKEIIDEFSKCFTYTNASGILLQHIIANKGLVNGMDNKEFLNGINEFDKELLFDVINAWKSTQNDWKEEYKKEDELLKGGTIGEGVGKLVDTGIGLGIRAVEFAPSFGQGIEWVSSVGSVALSVASQRPYVVISGVIAVYSYWALRREQKPGRKLEEITSRMYGISDPYDYEKLKTELLKYISIIDVTMNPIEPKFSGIVKRRPGLLGIRFPGLTDTNLEIVKQAEVKTDKPKGFNYPKKRVQVMYIEYDKAQTTFNSTINMDFKPENAWWIKLINKNNNPRNSFDRSIGNYSIDCQYYYTKLSDARFFPSYTLEKRTTANNVEFEQFRQKVGRFECLKFQKMLLHLLIMKTGYMIVPEETGMLDRELGKYEPQPHLTTAITEADKLCTSIGNPRYKFGDDPYDLENWSKRNIGVRRDDGLYDPNPIDTSTHYYLPVVHSTSENVGANLFAEYIKSLGFDYIVLDKDADDTVLDREKVRAIKKVYPRFHNPKGALNVLNELLYETDITKLRDGINKFIAQIRRDEPGTLFNEVPICVILTPDMTEGIDLKYNPAILLMEPPLCYGDYDQLCGRVLRTYSETYRVAPTKMIYQFVCFDAEQLKKINEERFKLFIEPEKNLYYDNHFVSLDIIIALKQRDRLAMLNNPRKWGWFKTNVNFLKEYIAEQKRKFGIGWNRMIGNINITDEIVAGIEELSKLPDPKLPQDTKKGWFFTYGNEDIYEYDSKMDQLRLLRDHFMRTILEKAQAQGEVLSTMKDYKDWRVEFEREDPKFKEYSDFINKLQQIQLITPGYDLGYLEKLQNDEFDVLKLKYMLFNPDSIPDLDAMISVGNTLVTNTAMTKNQQLFCDPFFVEVRDSCFARSQNPPLPGPAYTTALVTQVSNDFDGYYNRIAAAGDNQPELLDLQGRVYGTINNLRTAFGLPVIGPPIPRRDLPPQEDVPHVPPVEGPRRNPDRAARPPNPPPPLPPLPPGDEFAGGSKKNGGSKRKRLIKRQTNTKKIPRVKTHIKTINKKKRTTNKKRTIKKRRR